ncbi:MAG TPA: hypothetical protein VNJ08_14595 [Bacteriovoracaceae bacterium]|nr:hypothetical protein [Bacteriovoracaceae bacterium]
MTDRPGTLEEFLEAIRQIASDSIKTKSFEITLENGENLLLQMLPVMEQHNLQDQY